MLQEPRLNSPFFSLNIKQSTKTTAIKMRLFISTVNTRDLPHTKDFLIKNFPSVLKTNCINDQDLPFSVEVIETEIGHLFEHILLDQLCIIKIKSGAQSAVFNGTTSWNWQKNPVGTFQILIDVGKEEVSLLKEALIKTIQLTDQLLQPTFQALVLNQSSEKTTDNSSLRLPVVLN